MAGYASAIAASIRIRVAEPRDTSGSAPLDTRDESSQFLAIIWTLTGAATVFLTLRLYCKCSSHRRLWWDDYVITASWICLLVQTALLTVLVPIGFARPSGTVTNWEAFNMICNICGVFSITAAAWSKTSFAITLLRICEGWARRVIWIVIITVNLFLGLSGLFTYVQCNPVEKLWKSNVAGTCWPHHVIIYYNSFSSSWSGAMDILLATLPWKIIRTPFLSRNERIGVSIAMSMGVFAGLTSITKVFFLGAIQNPDPIAGVPLMSLATAEIAVTIIAASIPVLRALIRKNIPSTLSFQLYRSYRSESRATGSQGRGSAHSRSGSKASVPVSPRFVLGGKRSSRETDIIQAKIPVAESDSGSVPEAEAEQSFEIQTAGPHAVSFDLQGQVIDVERNGAWLRSDSEIET